MKESEQKQLEEKGWKFGSVKEFLELSDEETASIELKASKRKEHGEKLEKITLRADDDVIS